MKCEVSPMNGDVAPEVSWCVKCAEYHLLPECTEAFAGNKLQPAVATLEGGDVKYLELLDELRQLHLSKSADYGSGEDPLANLRACEKLGIEPWIGVMIRAEDKMARVRSLIRNGSLKNESIEDNLADLAAYSLLALRLYREKATA